MQLRTLTTLLLILPLLAACDKKDPEPDIALGTFKTTLSGGSVEEAWEGEAIFRQRNLYVNNTYRNTIQLKTSNETIIINLLRDRTDAYKIPPTGDYENGQFGPNSSAKTTLISEFWVSGSKRFTWVDNPGAVIITRADENRIEGTFDVSIIDDNTGNYVTFEGSFRAKPE